MNYRDHAAGGEARDPEVAGRLHEVPELPRGPCADVVLSSESRRLGGRARGRDRDGAAGASPSGTRSPTSPATRSARTSPTARMQFADKPPQFSMGKSLDGYGPIGPAVVSLDAFADPNDLALTCDVDGERMQDGAHRAT